MNYSADRPVRIGVVPRLEGSSGGIYQYSVTMLDGLLAMEPRPELVLFAEPRSRKAAEGWEARGYQIANLWPRTLRWRLRRATMRTAGMAKHVATAGDNDYQVRQQSAQVRQWIDRFGLDLMIFPAPSSFGFETGVPYVMAVHDLQHRLHPEFPEVSDDGEWSHREYLFRNGIKGALMTLVDSEIGREDVLDCYGDLVDADRVAVLPFLPASYLSSPGDASGAIRVQERFGLPERYLLFPAQFWPHKNHVRVVQALGRIRRERGIDVAVAMCGSAGDPQRDSVLERVRETARAEGVDDLVHYLGYVDDDLMGPLYSASRGVILPTFFGPTNIPVLEAWALGVPVLTSDIRGIREQCGDAAILVDPDSSESISQGMYSLWADEGVRRDLVRRGTQRLASYGRPEYLARLSAIVVQAVRRARDPALQTDGMVASSGGAPRSRRPQPTVTVVIPAHNRVGTISAAIESVRSQSFEDIEIIVVDDGSTDGTADIARLVALGEPRMRVLSHPVNRGAQAARNTGIRAARGEWVAFLDSDDHYYPDSIRLRLDEARRTGLGVVHSACDAITRGGTVASFAVPPVQGDVYKALLTAPAPMFQGLMVRRELLERIGLLDERVPAYQEWDSSIRLAAVSHFGYVPTPTFLYDLGTEGAISRDARRGVDGYRFVVSSHRREIVRVAGRRILATHFRILAEMRSRAGDRGGAVRFLLRAQFAWPLSPFLNLRVLRRVMGSRRVANGQSTPRNS
jgi:glycosyltransferase involved in cell wall biosynthesis